MRAWLRTCMHVRVCVAWASRGRPHVRVRVRASIFCECGLADLKAMNTYSGVVKRLSLTMWELQSLNAPSLYLMHMRRQVDLGAGNLEPQSESTHPVACSQHTPCDLKRNTLWRFPLMARICPSWLCALMPYLLYLNCCFHTSGHVPFTYVIFCTCFILSSLIQVGCPQRTLIILRKLILPSVIPLCLATQVFVENSRGDKTLGHPFGFLRLKRGASVVCLHLLPYNYPVLFRQVLPRVWGYICICVWGRCGVCLSVCLSVCRPVCLSLRLSVCLSVCLSICLYVSGCVSHVCVSSQVGTHAGERRRAREGEERRRGSGRGRETAGGSRTPGIVPFI
jgi:hypothetical protein